VQHLTFRLQAPQFIGVKTFKLEPLLKQTGLTRHPLVITFRANENVVDAPTAEAPPRETSGLRATKPPALLQAMEALFAGSASDGLAKRIERMRCIAFNAERLLFASSLWLATQDAELTLQLQNADEAIALGIALAMLRVETGEVPSRLNVQVPELEPTKLALRGVLAQATAALNKGCKACALHEVALCV
jgi:hypothetical protein